MLENLNDFLSIFILVSIPVGSVFYIVKKALKKRRLNRKRKEGKYYPEW